MNEIIHNLYHFYRETGTLASVSSFHDSRYSMVSGKEHTWPQMIYDIDLSEDPAQKLAVALEKATDRKHPGFAVCDASLFTTREMDILRGKSIFPVKLWTLMDAIPSKNPIFDLPEGFEVKELTTPGELYSFGTLINSGFMQTVKTDPGLIIRMHEKPAIHSYGLFAGPNLVSGLLTCSGSLSTGLYFIVTQPEYRGKRLAEKLIGHVMHLLSLKKTEKVILQAVQKAVPLYTRLGFVRQGKLIIFWKQV